MINVIEITTERKDYIIHVAPTIQVMNEYLRPIMESNFTMKIFFNLKEQIAYFQRDFNIFPIACIDMWSIYEQTLGIEECEPEECQTEMLKHLQPNATKTELKLDNEFISLNLAIHLVTQSYFMMKAWQTLKCLLAEKSMDKRELVRNSKEMTDTLYEKKVYRSAYEDMEEVQLTDEQKKFVCCTSQVARPEG